ncbi:MAG: hypothetical protein HQ589_01175 [Syntrophaceae bacterium]|nr:hypothetical protein [Syntrophaceae bacterium]
MKLTEVDRSAAAITSAGAGEHFTAREIAEVYRKKKTRRWNKKTGMRALVLGAISIILYTTVFTHQGLVTDFCTRGHWYAAFPIIIVLVFSLIHGPFANYSLSLLGVKAKKRK